MKSDEGCRECKQRYYRYDKSTGAHNEHLIPENGPQFSNNKWTIEIFMRVVLSYRDREKGRV